MTVSHVTWPLDLRWVCAPDGATQASSPTLFESFLRETWEDVSSELVTLGKILSACGEEEPTVREEQR